MTPSANTLRVAAIAANHLDDHFYGGHADLGVRAVADIVSRETSTGLAHMPLAAAVDAWHALIDDPNAYGISNYALAIVLIDRLVGLDES